MTGPKLCNSSKVTTNRAVAISLVISYAVISDSKATRLGITRVEPLC
jgi:hypothetical protein